MALGVLQRARGHGDFTSFHLQREAAFTDTPLDHPFVHTVSQIRPFSVHTTVDQVYSLSRAAVVELAA
jgi:hypothetical protein